MFSDRSLVLILAFVLPGAAGSAHAQSFLPDEAGRRPGDAAHALLIDRSDVESIPQLVDSLLQALSKLSSYGKPATTPRVSKVSRAEIERTVCDGPCAVKAWYMPGEGIFLDDSLTPETNLVHRSILFHELVHFVQDVNGEADSMDACHRWLHREREAYELQNQYLARIGDNGSYMQMAGNQSWLASNRHVCRAWDGPADADSSRSPQGFREADERESRQ
jgi:hypothetical protein